MNAPAGAADPARADVRSGGGWATPQAVAELGLVAVHVTVALGFARLYEDGSFVGPLLGFTLVAHVLAIGCRMLRAPRVLVAGVAVVGVVLVATWTLFPATASFGLPTGRTFTVSQDALSLARVRFSEVVAPTTPLAGFQLWAGLALWGSVWFADWAAFRLRSTVEPIVAAAVVFVFTAVFGSGRYELASATAFVGAALVFVAGQRAWRAQIDGAWVTGTVATGPRAIVRVGVTVAAFAVVVGAVVGPQLPGARSDALVRWRPSGSGNSSRITVSPLVDLRKRLVTQSNTEVFTVRANRAAYWRLTSLDRFDGQIWSSSGRYGPAGTSRLPTSTPEGLSTTTITQRFQIEGLSAIWAPSAFEARSVPRSTGRLRWDEGSSTLIVDGSARSSNGLSYTVVSDVPRLARTTLASAPSAVPAAIADRYERLPRSFPTKASALAQRVTAGANDRYGKARALQDWFRSRFTYDLRTNPGHSDSALLAFLNSRRGYCEQFAGAYAAMIRSLGIPARVAVGFTPGDRDRKDPTTFHVRGRHAHAWPEVWFAGVGWVPFEPTPGRGNPGSEAVTGVPAQQDNTRPKASSSPTTTTVGSTTTVTSAFAAGASPSATTTPSSDVRTSPTDPGRQSPGPSTWAVLLGAALAAAATWLVLVLAAPGIRQHLGRRGAPGDPTLDAWRSTVTEVGWLAGLSPFPAETHREFARRAAGPIGSVGPALTDLAEVASVAAWAPEPPVGDAGRSPSPERAERAVSLAAAIRRGLADRASWSIRLRRRLSWRSAFGLPAPQAGRSSSAPPGPSPSRRRRLRTRSPVSPK
ncbi:MAG: transglutaminaseTgpA domain-containing protein [Acidimicrobiales bacterium]